MDSAASARPFESMFRGQATNKEVQRRRQKAELGLCRIRRKFNRNMRSPETCGCGALIKNLTNQWPYKGKCVVVTNETVLPKEKFNVNEFHLDFRKLNSTIKSVRLNEVADSDTIQWFPSGLVLIVLKPPKVFGILKRSIASIFTYRPLTTHHDNKKGNLFCPVVDDTLADLYDVKRFAFKGDDQGQFCLHDEQSSTSFHTFDKFVGTSNRKPQGSVILTCEGTLAVGTLSSPPGKPNAIFPIWYSDLSSAITAVVPSSVHLQQQPLDQQPETTKKGTIEVSDITGNSCPFTSGNKDQRTERRLSSASLSSDDQAAGPSGVQHYSKPLPVVDGLKKQSETKNKGKHTVGASGNSSPVALYNKDQKIVIERTSRSTLGASCHQGADHSPHVPSYGSPSSRNSLSENPKQRKIRREAMNQLGKELLDDLDISNPEELVHYTNALYVAHSAVMKTAELAHEEYVCNLDDATVD